MNQTLRQQAALRQQITHQQMECRYINKSNAAIQRMRTQVITIRKVEK